MTQPTVPTEILEQRAAEQRRAIHDNVRHLKNAVTTEVRERTDVKRNVRRHFGPVSGVIAVIAISLGYGLAGIFTRD